MGCVAALFGEFSNKFHDDFYPYFGHSDVHLSQIWFQGLILHRWEGGQDLKRIKFLMNYINLMQHLSSLDVRLIKDKSFQW